MTSLPQGSVDCWTKLTLAMYGYVMTCLAEFLMIGMTQIPFSIYFSELSEVKEHDKRVTLEAHQAQEDVSCCKWY